MPAAAENAQTDVSPIDGVKAAFEIFENFECNTDDADDGSYAFECVAKRRACFAKSVENFGNVSVDLPGMGAGEKRCFRRGVKAKLVGLINLGDPQERGSWTQIQTWGLENNGLIAAGDFYSVVVRFGGLNGCSDTWEPLIAGFEQFSPEVVENSLQPDPSVCDN